MRYMCLLGGMALSTAALPVTPPPLQPSGRWVVDFADGMCVVARDFGVGPDHVTFLVRPYPLEDRAELVISHAGGVEGRSVEIGEGKLAIDDKTVAMRYENYADRAKNRHVMVGDADFALEDLNAAANVRLQAGHGSTVSLAVRGSPALMHVVNDCQADLLKKWGVDPATVADKPHRPQPATAMTHVFSSDDYPAAALTAGQHGLVLALLKVGVNGRPSSCRAMVSAGEALDGATCKALMENARFHPAMSPDGHPIEAWTTAAIRWAIPMR